MNKVSVPLLFSSGGFRFRVDALSIVTRHSFSLRPSPCLSDRAGKAQTYKKTHRSDFFVDGGVASGEDASVGRLGCVQVSSFLLLFRSRWLF
jgi:hypothetical protein